jgi:hypothetical protein
VSTAHAQREGQRSHGAISRLTGDVVVAAT